MIQQFVLKATSHVIDWNVFKVQVSIWLPSPRNEKETGPS